MSTIKDIAKECGVSVATVSMALSDKPSRVSENTKKKVREIAKKHNYRPNNAAVSLANKKSRLIGIVFNDLRNTHISSLFMAINGVLEKNGYSLVCHIIEDGQTIDTDIIRDIAADNIGALIWSKSMEMNGMQVQEPLSSNQIESIKRVENEKLGTGHGKRIVSQTQEVVFEKEQSNPNQVITIEYKSYEELESMGIVKRKNEKNRY